MAVVRTLDRHAAVVVVMVSKAFRDVARALLSDLHGQIGCEEIEAPPEAAQDWRLRRLGEDEDE